MILNMHGRFPTNNRYYRINEIFPLLSRKEMKEVYYPEKVKKTSEPFVKRGKKAEEDESSD